MRNSKIGNPSGLVDIVGSRAPFATSRRLWRGLSFTTPSPQRFFAAMSRIGDAWPVDLQYAEKRMQLQQDRRVITDVSRQDLHAVLRAYLQAFVLDDGMSAIGAMKSSPRWRMMHKQKPLSGLGRRTLNI